MEVNSWLGVAGAINMGVKEDGHEEQLLSVLVGPSFIIMSNDGD